MLTQTSITATRLLIHLGRSTGDEPAAIRQTAKLLGESPTYLAKVARQLAMAGIVRAQRGVAGGVMLNRPPSQISFLAIVEACQGMMLPDFCEENPCLGETCAFHQASAELHSAMTSVLARWTLADLLSKPGPSGSLKKKLPCWMQVGVTVNGKRRG